MTVRGAVLGLDGAPRRGAAGAPQIAVGRHSTGSMPGIAVEVVLMTISGDAVRTLLLQPEGSGWRLPSGAVGAREPLRRSAERVIAEQVGISVDYLEQLYTFGNTVPAA